MEKRALLQSASPLLPNGGFEVDRLLPPRQAIVAFFARVTPAPPQLERVAFGDALGRVLAQPLAADDDYPNARRSLMDGFAVRAQAAHGEFLLTGEVQMGRAPSGSINERDAWRIPTGGVLPDGADAVVPIEEARVAGGTVTVAAPVSPGANVAERGADMHRGEIVLAAGRRVRAPEMGVLATLGAMTVAVYRRPVVAVFSSGDELVEPSQPLRPGEIRDSNRYAVAASLRAMGVVPRHYPTLRDEAGDFEGAIASALRECDGVVVTGGSSVGERDRLPRAVCAIADPGIVVHGLRVKPGKPTLFGADGGKPIIGLPGNPTSAVMMLEGVAAPIIAALVGARVTASGVAARLARPLRSRKDWTWYVPVRLEEDGVTPLAHPLDLRSFSVSLTARADGYVVTGEEKDQLPAGEIVTVTRFLECVP